MKITDLCVSFELSKKLFDAGFPKDTCFSFTVGKESDLLDSYHFLESTFNSNRKSDDSKYIYTIPAPTASELSEALPNNYLSYKNTDGSLKWNCEYTDNDYKIISGDNDSEANAKAKMWLYLKENNLLETKQTNTR